MKNILSVVSALITIFSGPTNASDDNPKTTSRTTTGPHGLNLDGKMFNLSSGGVSFYPPRFSPTSPLLPSTPPDPTHNCTQHPTTTTTINPPQTSAPPTKGVSVCLRYLVEDEPKASNQQSTIFTLSPSRSPLILEYSAPGHHTLRIGGRSTWGPGDNYTHLFFKPHIRCLSNVRPDIWTRLCLTVDTVKNVAQMISGSTISFRKILPHWYVWSGEPVIDFPGFDGQVTDVQIWDYPIGYIEIYNFMTGIFGPNCGSVLTWSSISYSPRGKVLLEDVYEQQAKHPVSSARKRGHPKRKKVARECLAVKMKM